VECGVRFGGRHTSLSAGALLGRVFRSTTAPGAHPRLIPCSAESGECLGHRDACPCGGAARGFFETWKYAVVATGNIAGIRPEISLMGEPWVTVPHGNLSHGWSALDRRPRSYCLKEVGSTVKVKDHYIPCGEHVIPGVGRVKVVGVVRCLPPQPEPANPTTPLEPLPSPQNERQ